jgi:hypothetical protein
MWSHLLDEKGRKRASIFYKAAFYDRSARINPENRFASGVEPVGGWDGYDRHAAHWRCLVRDCGNIIWESETIDPEPVDSDANLRMEWAEKKYRLSELGDKWLDEHFPNWRDHNAYWD